MKKSVTSAVSRQIALSVCDYTCFLGKDLTEQQLWETIAFLVGVLLSHQPGEGESCEDVVEPIASRVYTFLEELHGGAKASSAE